MERADLAFQLAQAAGQDQGRRPDGSLFEHRDAVVPVWRTSNVPDESGSGELKEFSDTITEDLEDLRTKIYELAGREFNIGSPKQVGEVFEDLNISTGRKTATGQVSTSRDVLDELAQTYEIAKLIIDYREIDKLKSTYADALRNGQPDGRVPGVSARRWPLPDGLARPILTANSPVRTELGKNPRRFTGKATSSFGRLFPRNFASSPISPGPKSRGLKTTRILSKTARWSLRD